MNAKRNVLIEYNEEKGRLEITLFFYEEQKTCTFYITDKALEDSNEPGVRYALVNYCERIKKMVSSHK